MEQQSIPVTTLEGLIESRAAEAHAVIHEMAQDAIEYINRSTGQVLRHMRIRHRKLLEEYRK